MFHFNKANLVEKWTKVHTMNYKCKIFRDIGNKYWFGFPQMTHVKLFTCDISTESFITPAMNSAKTVNKAFTINIVFMGSLYCFLLKSVKSKASYIHRMKATSVAAVKLKFCIC